MARVPELWRTTMSSPACQQIFQDFVSRVREPPEGLRQPGSDSAQVPCDPRIQYAAVGDSDSEPGSTALSPPTYGRFLAVLGLAPTTVTDLLSSAWKWLSSVVSGLTSVGHVAAATGDTPPTQKARIARAFSAAMCRRACPRRTRSFLGFK
eukprot:605552_1